jgi:carbonic anhydrase
MKSIAKLSHALVFAVAIAIITFGAVLAQEGVHWSYEGDTGPDHWGSLSPDFATCGKGVEQSPVDIPASAPLNPADIAFAYQPSAVNIFNNGHTIQVNYDKGSSLTLNGVRYDLVQFHFHAASEHAVAGQHDPMELHLVHRNAQGGLAVVGVLLKSGGENAAYAPVFQNLPPQESQPAPVAGATVDASQLLPAQRTYWRYNGSLTTPPCTEGVKWLVMNTPVELSDAQIAAFTAIFKNDERPVQPFNARTFLLPLTLPKTGDGVVTLDGALVGAGVLAMAGGLALAYVSRRKAA